MESTILPSTTVNRSRPLEGVSLKPAFQAKDLGRTKPIFWEHEGNCALRDGKWKIVRKGNMGTGENTPWELYDMEADRTELHDLAAKMPKRLRKMADVWEAYALHAKAKPWPWGMNKKGNNKKKFTLQTGADLVKADAPQTSNRSLTIEARLKSTGDGVIVAQGGVVHGYTLYVKDGKPAFSMRHKGKVTTVTSDEALPAGACTITVELPVAGDVVLTVNGKDAARAKSPGAVTTPGDGLTVGQDGGDPVGPYEGPQEFQGKIEKVVIKLK